MIDYTKTQNTLQALSLQFRFIKASYIKKVMNKSKTEVEIINTLTNFMQNG